MTMTLADRLRCLLLALTDVKTAFVKRQKDVSESALLGVLKDLGAMGPAAPGKPAAPSLKYLDASKFAAAIAAVNALPKTNEIMCQRAEQRAD